MRKELQTKTVMVYITENGEEFFSEAEAMAYEKLAAEEAVDSLLYKRMREDPDYRKILLNYCRYLKAFWKIPDNQIEDKIIVKFLRAKYQWGQAYRTDPTFFKRFLLPLAIQETLFFESADEAIYYLNCNYGVNTDGAPGAKIVDLLENKTHLLDIRWSLS